METKEGSWRGAGIWRPLGGVVASPGRREASMLGKSSRADRGVSRTTLLIWCCACTMVCWRAELSASWQDC
eukprot:7150516-Prorocentrum_lima.AAC.1